MTTTVLAQRISQDPTHLDPDGEHAKARGNSPPKVTASYPTAGMALH
jgi:hypothetical protein